MRYAINATKLKTQLGWSAKENFDTGIRKTVQWYLSNDDRVQGVRSGEYLKWIDLNYGDRTG